MNVHAVPIATPRLADWWTLTKPGITTLVVVTAALGYYIAGGTDWSLLLLALAGTALVSAGSGAVNMAMEHDRDSKMSRTEDRPVAAGRVSYVTAMLYGLGLAALGTFILTLWVHPLVGGLAAASMAIYVLLYTPLKPITTLNTLVGAVSGAIPPMIGWAAATNRVDLGAWLLFAIMFFWQLPHFLAIAWMYRADYAQAGFAMLPVVDPEGTSTARQIILQTLALLAASLLPGWFGMASLAYFVTAALLGAGFLACGLAFVKSRTRTNARRVFLASIAYLPILLAVLAITKN